METDSIVAVPLQPLPLLTACHREAEPEGRANRYNQHAVPYTAFMLAVSAQHSTDLTDHGMRPASAQGPPY